MRTTHRSRYSIALSLLLAACCAGTAACGSSSNPSSPPASAPGQASQPGQGARDVPSQSLQQIAGNRYHWGKDSLTFGQDGSFEYLLNVDQIRYFLPRQGTGTPPEADAICALRLTGSAQLSGSGSSQTLTLSLQSVKVVSSAVYSADTATPAPAEVCRLYAAALQKKGSLQIPVSEVTGDLITLSTPSLDISNPNADPLATNNIAFGTSIYTSIGVAGTERHFSKDGAPIDISATVMPKLSGSFGPQNDSADAEQQIGVTIDPRFNDMVVIHHGCGDKYVLSISKITTAGNVLSLGGNVLQSSSFTPDYTGSRAPSAEYCDAFKKFMDSFAATGISLDYVMGQGPAANVAQLLFIKLGETTLYLKRK